MVVVVVARIFASRFLKKVLKLVKRDDGRRGK